MMDIEKERERFEAVNPVPDGVFLAYDGSIKPKEFIGYVALIPENEKTAQRYDGMWYGWLSARRDSTN